MVDFKEFDESVVDAPKKPKRSELVESISGHKVTLFHFWSYRPTLPGIIMVDFTHPKP